MLKAVVVLNSMRVGRYFLWRWWNVKANRRRQFFPKWFFVRVVNVNAMVGGGARETDLASNNIGVAWDLVGGADCFGKASVMPEASGGVRICYVLGRPLSFHSCWGSAAPPADMRAIFALAESDAVTSYVTDGAALVLFAGAAEHICNRPATVPSS